MSNDQGKVEDDWTKVSEPTVTSSSDGWVISKWDNSSNVPLDPTGIAAKKDNWESLAKEQFNKAFTKDERKKKTTPTQWANNNGMLKVIPTRHIQLMSYSTVSDIRVGNGKKDPVTQIFPISNASVNPHQISFDYFSTSEGKLGVSNPAEKHMVVECDVYFTDLLYYWWNGGAKKSNFGFNELTLNYLIFGKDYRNPRKKISKDKCKKLKDFTNYEGDFEQSVTFSKFRNAFLTYFTGWECKFVSHVFPTFYGVITDIKYDISEGESFAKWHMKIEEALFIHYNYDKEKENQGSQGSEGSGKTTGNEGDTGNSQTPTSDQQEDSQ